MHKLILSTLIGIIFYTILSLDNKVEHNISTEIEKISYPTLAYPDTRYSVSNYATAQLGGRTYSTETLGWIENSRGNMNYNKYPPCFNLSDDACKIYDILESKELIKKYKVLFEVLSILLCQYNFLTLKVCVNTMIQDRITNLDALGYIKHDNRYKNMLKNKIGTNYDESSQASLIFLLKSLTLIEDQLNMLKEDLNESDLEKINKSISKFYSIFLIRIAKDC